MEKILIKGGRLWNGEDFEYADVLTDGKVISRIAANIDEPADYVYDATGKTVTAGLVDIHTHMRGISIDKFGFDAHMCTIPFGVTAAIDVSAEKDNTDVIDTLMINSAVLVVANIVNDCADFTGTQKQLEIYGDRVVGVKVFFDTNAPDVKSEKPLRQICEFAHQRGLRVMVHSSNSPVSFATLVDVLGKGDIITHAFHGGKNNSSLDSYESMKIAKERGIIIDVGFAGHVHTDFAVLGGAIARGVIPDVISTDITRCSAYCRGGRYGMTMCMSIARTLGMSERDIFKSVTVNAASAVGKYPQWGTLRVGEAADIAVIDYSDESFELVDNVGNKVSSPTGYRCSMTMIDGEIIFRD